MVRGGGMVWSGDEVGGMIGGGGDDIIFLGYRREATGVAATGVAATGVTAVSYTHLTLPTTPYV